MDERNNIYLEDADKLRRACLLIDEFRKENPRMELQTVVTFLTVATLLNERQDRPTYVGELSEVIGITKTAASRNVRYLTIHGSLNSPALREKEGLNWLELNEDPRHRSRKIITLTSKGRKALTSLKFLMN